MIAKCECAHCAGKIEFEADQLQRTGETPYRVLGQNIECPHCRQTTQLYFPRHAVSGAPPVAKIPETIKSNGNISAKNLMACADCGQTISRRALICPQCGCAAGVRFRFVWDVMCHIAMVTLIFAFFGFVIAFIFEVIAGSIK